MKKLYLGLSILLLFSAQVFADAIPATNAGAYQKALKEFQAQFYNAALMAPKLFQNTDLSLQGTILYTTSELKDKIRWVTTSYRLWSSVLNKNGIGKVSTVVVVLTPSGGDLWYVGDHAELIQSWDDALAPYTGPVQTGRYFLFGGGQFAFGNTSTLGVTGRFGRTLLHDRADVALLFSYSELNNSGLASHTGSLGVVGRIRNSLAPGVGWNYGGQLIEALGDSASLGVGLLAGLNFAVKNGSIDLTANYNTYFSGSAPSTFAILLGYTVFLNN